MTVARNLICLAFAAALLAVPDSGFAQKQKYGTISGKFVLDGEVPKPVFLIKNKKLVKGGVPKNPEVCATKDLKSDALVIDPKSKGIGNIFVYLRKKPDHVHPKLKETPKQVLKFDQKQCRFIPHAMFVRAGQTVKVLSDDAAPHNTHTYPLINEANNFTVPPNFRAGVPLKHELPEPLPMKVGCDFHTWMTAYWLILDHPYGAVTVAEKGKEKDAPEVGTFKIEKLPYGEYEFRVWHEKAGYIGVDPKQGGTKRGFKVKVGEDEIELNPFKVKLKAFQ